MAGPWGDGAVLSQLEFSNAGDCWRTRNEFLNEPFNGRGGELLAQAIRCSREPVREALPVRATFRDESGAVVKGSFSSVRLCEYATRNITDRLIQACTMK